MKFDTIVTAQTKAAEAYTETLQKELNVEIPTVESFVEQIKEETQRFQTALTSAHAYGEYVKENIRRTQEAVVDAGAKAKEFFTAK